MTTPARRLRVVPQPTTTCAVCRQPMVWLGETTHPNCDPVYGLPPYGGRDDRRHRQLRLIEGGGRVTAPPRRADHPA